MAFSSQVRHRIGACEWFWIIQGVNCIGPYLGTGCLFGSICYHFMANRWENNGNSDRLFFSWAPKSLQMVSAAMKLKDGCSLPIKVCLVKNMVFPVVIYGCESWTIKKAECEGIDAFELWCWRRLLRVPWTARRSNQSILKEINIH